MTVTTKPTRKMTNKYFMQEQYRPRLHLWLYMKIISLHYLSPILAVLLTKVASLKNVASAQCAPCVNICTGLCQVYCSHCPVPSIHPLYLLQHLKLHSVTKASHMLKQRTQLSLILHAQLICQYAR